MSSDLVRCFGELMPTSLSTPRLIMWKPIMEECVVLNTDGSVMGSPSCGGFGGCMRDDSGRWLKGFFGFFNASN